MPLVYMGEKEMTLDEYVGVLPKTHIAVKELSRLRKRVKELDSDNDLLNEELAKRDIADYERETAE